MLIAATEQMKITELRLLKTLTAAQQKVTESAATSERRAGLVLNHLRGAQTLRMPICCQRSSRECTLHVSSILPLCRCTTLILHLHISSRSITTIHGCPSLCCVLTQAHPNSIPPPVPKTSPCTCLKQACVETAWESANPYDRCLRCAGSAPPRSPITTHVLDTSMGRPAPGETFVTVHPSKYSLVEIGAD